MSQMNYWRLFWVGLGVIGGVFVPGSSARSGERGSAKTDSLGTTALHELHRISPRGMTWERGPSHRTVRPGDALAQETFTRVFPGTLSASLLAQ